MTIRKSLYWVTLQFILVISIELIGLAILARILTPADMGQYALAFASVRLLQFLGSFGLFNVVVRSETMEQIDRARILGICLCTGTIASIAAVGLAFIVPQAMFGAEAQTLLQIMALVILPNCLATISAGLLSRQLQFRPLMILRVISSILFPAVAIPLALADYGAASLAIGYASSALVFFVLVLAVSAGAFILPPQLRGAAPAFRLATMLFASNSLNEVAEAALPNLIGRTLGVASLGLFSRSRDLVTRANVAIVDTIMPALTPHLMNDRREGREIGHSFILGLTNISAISMPIAALLSFAAPYVVRLLLGDQWLAAIPILQVLALGLALTPLTGLASAFLLALNMERVLVTSGAVYLAGMVLVGVVASAGGLAMVAMALVGLQMVMALLLFAVVLRKLAIGPRAILRALVPTLAVLVATLVPVAIVTATIGGSELHPAAALALQVTAAGMGWLAGLFAGRHPLRLEIVHILVWLRSRKSTD